MSSKRLHKARREKNDEFYTQYSDIDNEMKHYLPHFKDKWIFMNTDNPKYSQFWTYFKDNFVYLGLQKITSTHLVKDGTSYRLDYDGKQESKVNLNGNGDFRSCEVVEILKQVDIVVTNPPFSLFREYIEQLIDYNKKFIIIGHQNALTQRKLFKEIVDGNIWLGYGFKGNIAYFINKHYENYAVAGEHIDGKIRVSGVYWYTNIELDDGREPIVLTETYDKETYPTYDNYDAINVDRVALIPKNYKGKMGVPITFMNKYNPEQFEIIGLDSYLEDGPGKRFQVDGKTKYARLVVVNRNPEK